MQVTTARDLGALVRDRRRELGWSQDRLAVEVGVTRFWVIDLEAGRPGAKLDLVLKALAELGLIVEVSEPDERAGAAGQPLIDLDVLVDQHRERLGP